MNEWLFLVLKKLCHLFLNMEKLIYSYEVKRLIKGVRYLSMKDQHIISRIKSLEEELPIAERKIATFILNSPEAIIDMTASELGKAAGSSAATVIRLCKRVDILSFTQLKILVSREITQIKPVGYSDITPGEDVQDIMDKLLGNAIQTMQDTVSILKEKAMMDAVKKIEKAAVIYVFGVGASKLVAQNIAGKWSRIGKNTIYLDDAHLLIAAMTEPVEAAVFIGISNTGETKEVLKLMKIAKQNHCTTIAITRFGQNSLAELSDISLQHVRANEEELKSAATNSLHAQFIVVDILFFAYASQNYAKTIERVNITRQEIRKYNEFM